LESLTPVGSGGGSAQRTVFLFLEELEAWWIPYIFGTTAERIAFYQALYSRRQHASRRAPLKHTSDSYHPSDKVKQIFSVAPQKHLVNFKMEDIHD